VKLSEEGKSPNEGVRPMHGEGQEGGNYEAPGGGITKGPNGELRSARRQNYEVPEGRITKRPEAEV